MLSVRISSYGSTREIWRVREKLLEYPPVSVVTAIKLLDCLHLMFLEADLNLVI